MPPHLMQQPSRNASKPATAPAPPVPPAARLQMEAAARRAFEQHAALDVKFSGDIRLLRKHEAFPHCQTVAELWYHDVLHGYESCGADDIMSEQFERALHDAADADDFIARVPPEISDDGALQHLLALTKDITDWDPRVPFMEDREYVRLQLDVRECILIMRAYKCTTLDLRRACMPTHSALDDPRQLAKLHHVVGVMLNLPSDYKPELALLLAELEKGEGAGEVE